MKLSESQALFLRHTNETNIALRRGADFELGPVKAFRTRTVTSLEKKGFVTVGLSRFHGTNGGRTGVADVWVTAAGREALHNA